MAGNVLEQLVAEWYEYNGYFVRRNVKLAKIERGAHGELDVVGFHPRLSHLIHVEATVSKIDVDKYVKKFELARTYIHRVFDGLEIPEEIEQIALTTVQSEKQRVVLQVGTVMTVPEFYAVIFRKLKMIAIRDDSIPEEYPILRSLHYVCCPEYINSVRSVLCS